MKPTAKQVVAELQSMIRGYKLSYKERDGRVRNPEALNAIACLTEAIDRVQTVERLRNTRQIIMRAPRTKREEAFCAKNKLAFYPETA